MPSSIDGKISSPLSSTSNRLPDVTGGPSKQAHRTKELGVVAGIKPLDVVLDLLFAAPKVGDDQHDDERDDDREWYGEQKHVGFRKRRAARERGGRDAGARKLEYACRSSDTLCSKGRTSYLLRCGNGSKSGSLKANARLSASRREFLLFRLKNQCAAPRAATNDSLVHNRAQVHAHASQQGDQLRAFVRIQSRQRFGGD